MVFYPVLWTSKVASGSPGIRQAFLAIRKHHTKPCDPLRVLFCGSEHFSIASLQAIYEEHSKAPERIASIEVVCRPPKAYGRGLKQVRESTTFLKARWCKAF